MRRKIKLCVELQFWEEREKLIFVTEKKGVLVAVIFCFKNFNSKLIV